LRFDEVNVQKLSAAPVFSEHSFVASRAPLRGEDAATDATPTPVAAANAAVSTINPFILSSCVVGNPLLVSSRPVLTDDGELNDGHDSCERHAGQFVDAPYILLSRRAEPAKARFVGRDVERAEIGDVRIVSR
jgi:hypothetical protein